MSLYINNILISPTVINAINCTALSAQYDYAVQNGADEHIEMHIDGFTDLDVVQIYIMNRGTLSSDCPEQMCMVQLLCKYPIYITVSNLPHDADIIAYILQNGTNDAILENIDAILDIIKKIDNIEYIVEWTSTNMSAKIMCSAKFYSVIHNLGQKCGVRRIPYVTKMWCVDTKSMIDIPEYKHDGDTLYLCAHPFGYREDMTIIDSTDKFKNTIAAENWSNLYINCDLNVSIQDIINKHKLSWPDSSVFATWAIGPNCARLSYLFEQCPYEPYIYKWNVAYIIIISCMFRNAKINDLSMMSFDNCRNVYAAFAESTIVYPPKFANIYKCEKMFKDCYRLLECESIKTDNISTAAKMFHGCISLRNALNNCTFTKHGYLKTFKGCISLESALNNCTFPSGTMNFENVFINCMSLHNVLNNCGTIKLNIHKIMVNNDVLTKIEGTTFKTKLDINSHFVNCPNLKDVNIVKIYT